MSRTLITVLTWNRLKLLRNTLKTLHKHNGDCDIVVFDNGSSDGTVNWLDKKGYNVLQSSSNLGIFMATRQLWYYALENGYDFIVNLQNDFPCIRPIPFGSAESYLDSTPMAGFIRLNDKRKIVKVHSDGHKTVIRKNRSKNYLTGKKLRYKDWVAHKGVKFQLHNHHFSFNPNMFRSALVPHLVGEVRKPRELQIMEQFNNTGLLAARMKKVCFETIIRPRMKRWRH